MNVSESTQIASDSLSSKPKPARASMPPSHFATPASAANITAPSGNVPYAATSESEFADASCSGSLTMFGTDRVLRRPPQQRQHLDEEREHDEPEQVVEEREQREQTRRARCRS